MSMGRGVYIMHSYTHGLLICLSVALAAKSLILAISYSFYQFVHHIVRTVFYCESVILIENLRHSVKDQMTLLCIII